MNIIISEPNLVGFLSAVYDSYYEFKEISMVSSDKNVPMLVDKVYESKENLDKAAKVRAGIIKKGGIDFYNKISTAYRSGKDNKEQIIFDYLRLFFDYGAAIFEMLDNAKVLAFEDILNKVNHEIHRLSAFIRLQEMKSGIYYGYYSSDNDILEKIAPRLTERFNSSRFIIHDYKRLKMAFYDGRKCHYLIAPEKVEIELSEAELFFQKIWKDYHKNVSIKGRENPKLQAAFLPKRYRYFMNEF